jgi:amidase
MRAGRQPKWLDGVQGLPFRQGDRRQFMKDSAITIDESGAFVETFALEATTGQGLLARLTFAVKDLIDIAGYKTGCGNPTWRDTHPAARSHAVCVEQLLAAGATFLGKTVTYELAFSLVGENYFYGTPLNAAVPKRMPGGSSSGSASAVSCDLVDFAIGTDTGGSVRVPASNCGIWGYRPSHGFVSVAGVMPFAPTFDTVGVLARSAEVMARAAKVLLGAQPDESRDHDEKSEQPAAILVARDAFEMAEPAAIAEHEKAIAFLRSRLGYTVREASVSDLIGCPLGELYDTYCPVQWAEIESSLGSWIEEHKPQFGPVTTKNFELVRALDRTLIKDAVERREKYYRTMRKALGPRDLVCIPTTPAPAPVKGSLGIDQRSGDYYRKALALTSIAGIGRLPQISMPLSTVAVEDGSAPLGLSLLGSFGEDAFLLGLVQEIDRKRMA